MSKEPTLDQRMFGLGLSLGLFVWAAWELLFEDGHLVVDSIFTAVFAALGAWEYRDIRKIRATQGQKGEAT